MSQLPYRFTVSDPTKAAHNADVSTILANPLSEKRRERRLSLDTDVFAPQSSNRVSDGVIKIDPSHKEAPRPNDNMGVSSESSTDSFSTRNSESSSPYSASVSDVPVDPGDVVPRSLHTTVPEVTQGSVLLTTDYFSFQEAAVRSQSGQGSLSDCLKSSRSFDAFRDSQNHGICESAPSETTPESSASSLSGATLANSPSAPESDFERTNSITNTPPTVFVNAKYFSASPQRKKLRPTQFFGVYSRVPAVSISSCDRFLSPRLSPEICRERLLTSLSTATLSVKKKAVRQTSTMSNPFLPRFRSTQVNIGVNPHQRQAPAPFLLTTLALRVDRVDEPDQVVSVGALRRTEESISVSSPEDGLEGSLTRASGTIGAPRYRSRYLQGSTADDDRETYEKRIALALGLDTASSILTRVCSKVSFPTKREDQSFTSTQREMEVGWRDNEWIPNRIDHFLEAPNLRNDYYCSVLAHSKTANVLAVGLSDKLYLWSEEHGVSNAPPQINQNSRRSTYITSLSFSSESGSRAVLAVGRSDGQVTLYSPLDEELRILSLTLTTAAAYVSFRPVTHRRISQRHSAFRANNEVLVIGEDSGSVSLYYVEWPTENEKDLFSWNGGVLLYARVKAHAQQVCGIAWSSDGNMFATGGNDNLCCLFDVSRMFKKSTLDECNAQPSLGLRGERLVPKHQWHLTAAVKAMAFCPWQKGLMAVGGGSNDRCIHFFHTLSSARLATIDCAAQVTSLMWSKTKRELAATFGFAQPEHPYRIAVYSWPSCQQVLAIPWQDDMRALYAIPYPGGPHNGRSSTRGRGSMETGNRTVEEGSIVVAASDGSIKFHEIWYGYKGSVGTRRGLFGGSSILEGLHGVEKDSMDIIR